MLYVHPRGRADALFWVGLALWALGWYINLHSDNVLRNLRAPGETGEGLPWSEVLQNVDGLLAGNWMLSLREVAATCGSSAVAEACLAC